MLSDTSASKAISDAEFHNNQQDESEINEIINSFRVYILWAREHSSSVSALGSREAIKISQMKIIEIDSGGAPVGE